MTAMAGQSYPYIGCPYGEWTDERTALRQVVQDTLSAHAPAGAVVRHMDAGGLSDGDMAGLFGWFAEHLVATGTGARRLRVVRDGRPSGLCRRDLVWRVDARGRVHWLREAGRTMRGVGEGIADISTGELLAEWAMVQMEWLTEEDQ